MDFSKSRIRQSFQTFPLRTPTAEKVPVLGHCRVGLHDHSHATFAEDVHEPRRGGRGEGSFILFLFAYAIPRMALLHTAFFMASSIDDRFFWIWLVSFAGRL